MYDSSLRPSFTTLLCLLSVIVFNKERICPMFSLSADSGNDARLSPSQYVYVTFVLFTIPAIFFLTGT